MYAAVYRRPLDVALEQVPAPEATAGHLLVRVRACGICGSDLHMYRAGGMFEDLGRPLGDGRIVVGHEVSGDVVALGDGVSGFEVGDRVTGIGHGGMAELSPVPVSDKAPHLLPDSVSYAAGATLEPLATSIHAVDLARVAAGETVVVLGAGIIGLGCVQVLAERGCAPIVVDRSPKRLAMARELGAGATVDLGAGDPVAAVLELTGRETPRGVLARPGGRADAVLDCAGAPSSPDQGLTLLKGAGGRLVLVAMFESQPALDLNQVVRKHATVLGSWIWTGDDYRRAVAMAADGRVDRARLISHRFPLAQVREAFSVQADVDASIKVVVEI